jgi:hypothetical protein
MSLMRNGVFAIVLCLVAFFRVLVLSRLISLRYLKSAGNPHWNVILHPRACGINVKLALSGHDTIKSMDGR